MFFEGVAWAQTGGAPASTDQLILSYVVPLALLFGIFYFLIIRPQTQRENERKKMLSTLKRNDEVVTGGGLIGRITELGDRVVTLEVAPNVRVRVERPQITSLSSYGKTPAKKGE
jgi:preprotein translocase subunit YajC